MEGKKIYLKATKYLKGDMFDTTNVNDFFKQAKNFPGAEPTVLP